MDVVRNRMTNRAFAPFDVPRFVRAFPVLNDGSDVDRRYRQNAEPILLQSVAASTMSAHLAAAALGYAVWWITAIGQEDIQSKVPQIVSWERFDPAKLMTDPRIDEWIRTQRHKVMYRDESKVD
jgi:5,6-dimethylbenzimidazole synthase